MTVVLAANSLARAFPGSPPVTALRDASLTLAPGTRTAILGPSGSGKSTLLNLLGLLDTPSSGTYELMGCRTTHMSERSRDRLRRDHIGFVFQAYHVLGTRTARENLDLKMSIACVPRVQRQDLVAAALNEVGLTHRADVPARNLSGGEKQRLAIARAMALSPSLLLADEPTGNLDRINADAVLDLLARLVEVRGTAVLVISHDPQVATWADAALVMADGVLTPLPA